MQLPDRFQYWQPILDGLSDCQTYPVGEFSTIRDEDDKDVIIRKVKNHFTTVVANWIWTAVSQVEFPDKKKRTSSTQLGVAERALVRGLFTYKAIMRKRCAHRFEAAVKTIQGYTASLSSYSDNDIRAILDNIISEITRRGKLPVGRKTK